MGFYSNFLTYGKRKGGCKLWTFLKILLKGQLRHVSLYVDTGVECGMFGRSRVCSDTVVHVTVDLNYL